MSITPNAEQFTEYAQSDLEGEVVMLNLLKFDKSGATDDESGEAISGRPRSCRTRTSKARRWPPQVGAQHLACRPREHEGADVESGASREGPHRSVKRESSSPLRRARDSKQCGSR